MAKTKTSHDVSFRDRACSLVTDPAFKLEQIPNLYDMPTGKHRVPPGVTVNLQEIAAVLSRDRNGDKVFSFQDLLLLSQNPLEVIHVLICVNKVASAISKDRAAVLDMLVFYCLIVVFLQLIPSETGISWSNSDKVAIVDCCVCIMKAREAMPSFEHMKRATKKLRDVLCCVTNDPTAVEVESGLTLLDLNKLAIVSSERRPVNEIEAIHI
jgi:hypothetical protein